MFLVYFLLAAGELFKQKFVKLSGERLSHKKVTVQMIDEIIAQIGQFVFYQFWSGLLVGVADLAGASRGSACATRACGAWRPAC